MLIFIGKIDEDARGLLQKRKKRELLRSDLNGYEILHAKEERKSLHARKKDHARGLHAKGFSMPSLQATCQD